MIYIEERGGGGGLLNHHHDDFWRIMWDWRLYLLYFRSSNVALMSIRDCKCWRNCHFLWANYLFKRIPLSRNPCRLWFESGTVCYHCRHLEKVFQYHSIILLLVSMLEEISCWGLAGPHTLPTQHLSDLLQTSCVRERREYNTKQTPKLLSVSSLTANRWFIPPGSQEATNRHSFFRT